MENKKKYSAPELEVIQIDNEITMVMMSANPTNDPGESLNSFNIENPFKLSN